MSRCILTEGIGKMCDFCNLWSKGGAVKEPKYRAAAFGISIRHVGMY